MPLPENFSAELVFQFPSNGKVFPNVSKKTLPACTVIKVSIPFKREGVSERINQNVVDVKRMLRFNSLQTGRCFRTKSAFLTKSRIRVSIPFKREGVSELSLHPPITACWERVSIPFKREGVSEPQSAAWSGVTYRFQFPSNGKVFPNVSRTNQGARIGYSVSIPFKREGVSERKHEKIEIKLS